MQEIHRQTHQYQKVNIRSPPHAERRQTPRTKEPSLIKQNLHPGAQITRTRTKHKNHLLPPDTIVQRPSLSLIAKKKRTLFPLLPNQPTHFPFGGEITPKQLKKKDK